MHGLTGLVKVDLYWGESSALAQADAVVVVSADGQERRLELERAVRGAKNVLVKFRGVDDRDAATALVGGRVFVDRSVLGPLAPGEAYLVDLVGAEVVAPDGPVGRIVEVFVNPSVDSVMIEGPAGQKYELPLVPTFVEKLDMAERRVYLSNRDGLIE